MSIPFRFRNCLAASALLATTSFAIAQTSPAPAAKTAPSSTQPATAREASSGMATGRRQQQAVAPAATTPADPATAEAKKHIANVKWEERQATPPPALDAASKDAAKAPTTLDGASKDAAKSKTAPPANPSEKKRENSVDSFSVQH